MKKLYTSLIMPLTLFFNTAWAPAYSSDSDDEVPLIEFRKFQIGDKISLEHHDSTIERKEVVFDQEVYEVKTHVITLLPQRLIQFRQEGDYYRLYTRPRMSYGFVKQAGLWQYKGSDALAGCFWSSCYRIS